MVVIGLWILGVFLGIQHNPRLHVSRRCELPLYSARLAVYPFSYFPVTSSFYYVFLLAYTVLIVTFLEDHRSQHMHTWSSTLSQPRSDVWRRSSLIGGRCHAPLNSLWSACRRWGALGDGCNRDHGSKDDYGFLMDGRLVGRVLVGFAASLEETKNCMWLVPEVAFDSLSVGVMRAWEIYGIHCMTGR